MQKEAKSNLSGWNGSERRHAERVQEVVESEEGEKKDRRVRKEKTDFDQSRKESSLLGYENVYCHVTRSNLKDKS